MTAQEAANVYAAVTDPNTLTELRLGTPLIFENDEHRTGDVFTNRLTDLFRPPTPDGKVTWINGKTGAVEQKQVAPGKEWRSPEIERGIRDFIASVTPQERSIAESSKTSMVPVMQAVNNMWQKTYGRDRFPVEAMPHTDEALATDLGVSKSTVFGYSPRFRNTDVGTKKSDMGRRLVELTLEESGAQKSRGRNLRVPMLIRNHEVAFMQRAGQLSRIAHLQEPVRYAFDMLRDSMGSGSQGFRDQLQSIYGKDAVEDIDAYLDRAAGFAQKPMPMPAFDRAVRNFIVGRLALRVTSYLSNRYTSIIPVYELMRADPDMGERVANDFAKRAFGPVPLTSKQAQDALNKLMQDPETGYFWKRWTQDMFRAYSATDLENPASQITKMNLATAEMQNFAMGMFANAEQKMAVSAFQALKAAGFSDTQATKKVEEFFRKSQNPSDSLEESAALRRMKMANWGWMFPYIGQAMAIRNLIVDGILGLKDPTQRAASRRMLVALGLAFAMQETFRALVRSAIRPDDEDEEKKRRTQTALNLMRDVLGTLAPGSDALLSVLSTGETDQSLVAQGIKDTLALPRLGIRAVTADETDSPIENKQVAEALWKSLSATATWAGIPASGGVDQLAQFIMERTTEPTKQEKGKRTKVAVMDNLSDNPTRAEFQRAVRIAYREGVASGMIEKETSLNEFKSSFRTRVTNKYGKDTAKRLGFREEKKTEKK